jgi:predicted RNA-binding protein with PIN domain
MLFLIDGYNVTRSDPATTSLELEGQRDHLIARLRARGPRLLGAGRIIVVFDGAEGMGTASGGSVPVEVRFSRDEDADDLIVRLAAGACERVCLVSSDVALADRVRAVALRGAEARGRETLFEAAGRGGTRRRGGSGADADSLGVPPGGRSITRELERLWIDGEDEG